MKQKNFTRTAWICFLFCLVITFSFNRSLASSKAMEPKSADINRILISLENKIEGPALREKIKDKLSTLDHKQILLIVSLSERIAYENSTTGKEIAILLIAALIVFS